ncbi:MAG TPA: hypothetical protein VEC36_08880, partial [Patescibacteria group bacterium]|nr:hypothetical protein [Patescibacteria group bacterium]
KKQAPFTVEDYTMEFQEGIILKSNVFRTDSAHFGLYTVTKFDLGAGLVSGNFMAPLQQTFPVNKKGKVKIEHGSFKDLPMIIMD